MKINDVDEFKSNLQKSLSSAYDLLTEPEVEFAITQALGELGWNYPLTSPSKVTWAMKRAKRHALDTICTVSAHKFKYKQINLNQRFEHYFAIIKQMDEEYRWGLENDAALMGVDSANVFGTYIRNGFVYDQYGRDVTKFLNSLGYNTSEGGQL